MGANNKPKKPKCPACGKIHAAKYGVTGTNRRRDITSKTFTILKQKVDKNLNPTNHQFRRKDPADREILEMLDKAKKEIQEQIDAANAKKKGSGGSLGSHINLRKDLYMYVPEPVQVHHLITIGAVGGSDDDKKHDKDWYLIFYKHRYDINCPQNAVVLPSDMLVACHYKIPLHKGAHDSTDFETTISEKVIRGTYVAAVKELIKGIKRHYKKDKKKCDEIDVSEIRTFHNEMLKKSELIFDNIKEFDWFISSDGYHYDKDSNIGCYKQCRTLEGKRELMQNDKGNEIDENLKPQNFFKEIIERVEDGCPDGRNHKDHGCEMTDVVEWKYSRYSILPTDKELGF